MAVLTNADRAEVHAEMSGDFSRERIPCSLTKAEVRAAINAADDWVDANAASYNTALPQPARGALSSSDKARLLMRVITKRFIKGV